MRKTALTRAEQQQEHEELTDIIDEMEQLDHEWREKKVLTALKRRGFCLAFLAPSDGPAGERPDFTVFLPSLGGCPSLIVAVRVLTLPMVEKTIQELPQRSFADGTKIQLADEFYPTSEGWFRFQTEIVYMADAAVNPPFPNGNLDRWAHCADLTVTSAGKKPRPLRVIHVHPGPSRDDVFLNFLIPHRLVPRIVLR